MTVPVSGINYFQDVYEKIYSRTLSDRHDFRHKLASIISPSHRKQDEEATPLFLIHLSNLSSSVSPMAKLSVIMTRPENTWTLRLWVCIIYVYMWLLVLCYFPTLRCHNKAHLLTQSGPLWGDCKWATVQPFMLVHRHIYTPTNNAQIFHILNSSVFYLLYI